MFDSNLEICGACGVPRRDHAEKCDPTALRRVKELEEQLDRHLDALLSASSRA